MYLIKNVVVILIFLLIGTTAQAQEMRNEFRIDFRLGSSLVEPDFSDNKRQMAEMKDFLSRLADGQEGELVSVTFCGTVSPDGSYQLNTDLSRRRLSVIEQMVREQIQIPEEIVSRDDHYIPWHTFKAWVEASDIERKDSVLKIIDEEPRIVPYTIGGTIDERVHKLMMLDSASVWKQLDREFFADMRSASTVIVTLHKEAFTPPTENCPEPEHNSAEVVAETIATDYEKDEFTDKILPTILDSDTQHIYLKTNAIGLGLLMLNAAGEIDLAPHASFAFPIYYSAVNYFTYSLKFRTLSFQPEVRYWFSPHNDGFFLGGHIGLSYFDFAFRGTHRYQDHNRNSPSIGIGASAGYRLPVSRNKRWKMEFAIGCGVHSIYYDMFLNVPNGRRTDIKRMTYFGIDQAAINVAYTFDINRKGGAKK